jgi:FlaG/FlaF family flagellin (archaellin)
VLLWVCTGLRLNAVLGGSALHPIDGGYIIKVLRCPELVTAIVAASCLSVYVYSIMAEAEGSRIATHTENSSSNLNAKQCFNNGTAGNNGVTAEYSAGWPYSVNSHTHQVDHTAVPGATAIQWQKPTTDNTSHDSAYTAHGHITTLDSTTSQSTQQNR